MSHVLVVDDHENTAKAMAALLRRLGYDASCAFNANDALEILSNRSTSLVLLDVMMPQTSGLRLLETMRADSKLPSVPVIIHSAYCDPATQSEALRLGAVSYLLKDYLPLSKIREVVETYAGKVEGAQVAAE
jgi:CheY-like chemotaxis protein